MRMLALAPASIALICCSRADHGAASLAISPQDGYCIAIRNVNVEAMTTATLNVRTKWTARFSMPNSEQSWVTESRFNRVRNERLSARTDRAATNQRTLRKPDRRLREERLLKLYTIGFAKTTAEEFFAKLRDNRVRVVLDTRLRRAGQLAGFAKMPDLQFFLRALYGIGYDVHPDLAPTEELLKRYRDKRVTWDDYALEYSMLLRERRPERGVSVSYFADACLLCLERSPEKCHRRLAAQYLRDAYDDDIEVSHL